jgi:hypothetical protein
MALGKSPHLLWRTSRCNRADCASMSTNRSSLPATMTQICVFVAVVKCISRGCGRRHRPGRRRRAAARLPAPQGHLNRLASFAVDRELLQHPVFHNCVPTSSPPLTLAALSRGPNNCLITASAKAPGCGTSTAPWENRADAASHSAAASGPLHFENVALKIGSMPSTSSGRGMTPTRMTAAR